MNENNEKIKSKELNGLLTADEVKKRKSNKRKVVFSLFVMLLAVGIGGNWYWENSDISSKINMVSSSAKTLGEATFVDATTEVTTGAESEYFSSARLDRQSARDKALEELQSVVSSSQNDEDAHKEAAVSISRISDNIEAENKIETLVQAKGVKNCLAVVNNNGESVDVIIDSSELTDELILQIKEIATSQLNCSFENVTIIQAK